MFFYAFGPIMGNAADKQWFCASSLVFSVRCISQQFIQMKVVKFVTEISQGITVAS